MHNRDFQIGEETFQEINAFLSDPKNSAVTDLRRVVSKFGSVSEINERAREAGKVENLVKKLERMNSPFVKDIEWLTQVCDEGKLVSLSDYRSRIDPGRPSWDYDHSRAATLEISAMQYFPWLLAEVKQSIEKGGGTSGRFIRVRKMKEQEADGRETFPQFTPRLRFSWSILCRNP